MIREHEDDDDEFDEVEDLSPEQHRRAVITKWLVTVVLGLLGIFMAMSIFDLAGNAGARVYSSLLFPVFGYGAVIVPILLITIVGYRLFGRQYRIYEIFGTVGLLVAVLAFLDIMLSTTEIAAGGSLGTLVGGAFFVKNFGIFLGMIFVVVLLFTSGFILYDPHLVSVKTLVNALRRDRQYTAQDDVSEEDEDEDEEGEDDDDEEEDEEEEVATPAPQKPQKTSADIKVFSDADKKKEEEFAPSTMRQFGDYTPPPLNLLEKSSGKASVGDIKTDMNQIQRTLQNFAIDVEMDEVTVGPTVTRFALKPAQGVKLSRIVGLKSDLALALAAPSIRIEAPIPGKALVGIEIPNKQKAKIRLGSMLGDSEFQNSANPLQVAIGKSVAGKSIYSNVNKMPHTMIAGTTGSGKSIMIHNIVLSLLYRNGPDELRLIMIDPKRVEMTLYNNIPHLLAPVVVEAKQAVLALKWAVKEMERRLEVLQKNSVRDIAGYHNNIVKPAQKKKNLKEGTAPEKMPYIVIVIDEMADLMTTFPREIESSIVRIAQIARAVGIHLILATQRPSVNVITGLIKANVPARVAFRVASQVDSRTILDTIGAESLIGAGDMLFQGSEGDSLSRIQSPFVSDDEVKAVAEFIKKHNQRIPENEISFPDSGGSSADENGGGASSGDDDDPLVEEAKQAVVEAKKASTSFLQRKFRIGYSRAARLMDILEERGIIGPQDGSKPREILYDPASDQYSAEDFEREGFLGEVKDDQKEEEETTDDSQEDEESDVEVEEVDEEDEVEEENEGDEEEEDEEEEEEDEEVEESDVDEEEDDENEVEEEDEEMESEEEDGSKNKYA